MIRGGVEVASDNGDDVDEDKDGVEVEVIRGGVEVASDGDVEVAKGNVEVASVISKPAVSKESVEVADGKVEVATNCGVEVEISKRRVDVTKGRVEVTKDRVEVAKGNVEVAINVGAEAVTVKTTDIPSPSKSLPTAEAISGSLGLSPSGEQRKATL